LPLDTDLVIDCRFLPNPHWVEDLRPQTGLDAPVREYVMGQPVTAEFLDELTSLLELLLPAYVAEGKSYLTLALGCTGGHHRSVVIAEEIAARLSERGYDPKVSHRDIGR
ncbi:MAG: RapZ C-terminal domain-containing protein, partial [Acidimicrobiales bacterium]